MKDIWLISDTHFNHANILNFRDSWTNELIRPGFKNVEEMDEKLIDNWNSVVKDGDIVYHLGDVVMGDRDAWMKKNWARLRGSKRLIVGNHDDIKSLVKGNYFKKVYLQRKMPEQGIIMTHLPIDKWSAGSGSPTNWIQLVNVHGHIHQNDSPPGPYVNVSVEKTNFKPIHLEEVKKLAKEVL